MVAPSYPELEQLLQAHGFARFSVTAKKLKGGNTLERLPPPRTINGGRMCRPVIGRAETVAAISLIALLERGIGTKDLQIEERCWVAAGPETSHSGRQSAGKTFSAVQRCFRLINPRIAQKTRTKSGFSRPKSPDSAPATR